MGSVVVHRLSFTYGGSYIGREWSGCGRSGQFGYMGYADLVLWRFLYKRPRKYIFLVFFTIYWAPARQKIAQRRPRSSRPLARPPRREAALAADLITA